MISQMASIFIGCLKSPGRQSVWSPQLGRYVCPENEADRAALRAVQLVAPNEHGEKEAAHHPPINPQFKLVFLTAAGGTLLFAILCVTLTFLVGKEPKPLFEKVVIGLFDLVKIGFGAVVGLLGGKTLQGDPSASKSKRLHDSG